MNLRKCNVHDSCISILCPKFNHEMKTKKEKWIHLETITYLTIFRQNYAIEILEFICIGKLRSLLKNDIANLKIDTKTYVTSHRMGDESIFWVLDIVCNITSSVKVFPRCIENVEFQVQMNVKSNNNHAHEDAN